MEDSSKESLRSPTPAGSVLFGPAVAGAAAGSFADIAVAQEVGAGHTQTADRSWYIVEYYLLSGLRNLDKTYFHLSGSTNPALQNYERATLGFFLGCFE